jgi:menaquinone-dependent protoporphyrinogen oxidase
MTKPKILMSVASKHGSTVEIAETVANVLRDRGHEVVAVPPVDVCSLAGFPVVILGSAVYLGRWLKPATHLVDRLVNDLATRTVYAFSSGPVGSPPFPDRPASDLDAFVARTGAKEHVTFPGRLVNADLAIGERLAVRVSGADYGDFRDWPAVVAWANRIADDLAATSQLPPGKGRRAGDPRDVGPFSPAQRAHMVLS